MTVIATASNPRFLVSRVDIDRGGPTYTVDTLTDLRKQYPDAELFFITGADALEQILSWHRVESCSSSRTSSASPVPATRWTEPTCRRGRCRSWRSRRWRSPRRAAASGCGRACRSGTWCPTDRPVHRQARPVPGRRAEHKPEWGRTRRPDGRGGPEAGTPAQPPFRPATAIARPAAPTARTGARSAGAAESVLRNFHWMAILAHRIQRKNDVAATENSRQLAWWHRPRPTEGDRRCRPGRVERLVITDCFVIASAPNERQIDAIVDQVEEDAARRCEAGAPGRDPGRSLGAARLRRRGRARPALRGACLLPAGTVWKDCPRIPFEDQAEPASDEQDAEA